MKIPRMNHACLAYKVDNNWKIMVAGGVTTNSKNQSLLTNKVEVLDFATNVWKFEADFPNLITGMKLIEVDGQPAIVGRYGRELTNQILRYREDNQWQPLPVNLLKGRSDFQILPNMQDLTFKMYPRMNSKTTKVNPDPTKAGDRKWRRKFGSVKAGKKEVWKTGPQIGAWVQLDLGSVVEVSKVHYRSGRFGDMDTDYQPQTVEVRVG